MRLATTMIFRRYLSRMPVLSMRIVESWMLSRPSISEVGGGHTEVLLDFLQAFYDHIIIGVGNSIGTEPHIDETFGLNVADPANGLDQFGGRFVHVERSIAPDGKRILPIRLREGHRCHTGNQEHLVE